MREDFKDFAEYIWINYRDRRIVEVGIGPDDRVFNILSKKGTNIVSTDVKPAKSVYVDDITQSTDEIYAGADLIYSIRPPPELHPYLESMARRIGADLIIKPMSTDPCSVGRLIGYKKTTFYLSKKRLSR